MLEKFKEIEIKYKELEGFLSDPEIISNQNEFQKYAKAHAALTEIVTTFREYEEVLSEIEGTKELLAEEEEGELKDLAELEIQELEERQEGLEEKLKLLLVPKDPNDDKNVIMEVRAGTGGEEAALFAGDLFRMYSRYVEKKNWSVELLSESPTDIGGYKEVVFQVSGQGAYSRLKFESGVHRVQRVPTTET